MAIPSNLQLALSASFSKPITYRTQIEQFWEQGEAETIYLRRECDEGSLYFPLANTIYVLCPAHAVVSCSIIGRQFNIPRITSMSGRG